MPKKKRPQLKTRHAQPTRALSAISRRTTFEGHLFEDVDDGSGGPDLQPTNFVPINDVGCAAPDMETLIDAMRDPRFIKRIRPHLA